MADERATSRYIAGTFQCFRPVNRFRTVRQRRPFNEVTNRCSRRITWSAIPNISHRAQQRKTSIPHLRVSRLSSEARRCPAAESKRTDVKRRRCEVGIERVYESKKPPQRRDSEHLCLLGNRRGDVIGVSDFVFFSPVRNRNQREAAFAVNQFISCQCIRSAASICPLFRGSRPQRCFWRLLIVQRMHNSPTHVEKTFTTIGPWRVTRVFSIIGYRSCL